MTNYKKNTLCEFVVNIIVWLLMAQLIIGCISYFKNGGNPLTFFKVVLRTLFVPSDDVMPVSTYYREVGDRR